MPKQQPEGEIALTALDDGLAMFILNAEIVEMDDGSLAPVALLTLEQAFELSSMLCEFALEHCVSGSGADDDEGDEDDD